MAKQRGTVDLYISTRELLKRIIAVPGNGRSQPVMIDILVRAEAARLGLIEPPIRDPRSCPKCRWLIELHPKTKKQTCTNPACDYAECPDCGNDLLSHSCDYRC